MAKKKRNTDKPDCGLQRDGETAESKHKYM